MFRTRFLTDLENVHEIQHTVQKVLLLKIHEKGRKFILQDSSLNGEEYKVY